MGTFLDVLFEKLQEESELQKLQNVVRIRCIKFNFSVRFGFSIFEVYYEDELLVNCCPEKSTQT